MRVRRQDVATAPPDGARVLLVEDNPITQHIVRGILSNAGLQVEVAEHGPEALELVARKSYDLILMDCRLPAMDGYEVTRSIRRREESAINGGGSEPPRVSIVALTANDQEGDRERCLAAGMDDYLSKTLLPGQLYDRLERWLPGVGSPLSTSAAP